MNWNPLHWICSMKQYRHEWGPWQIVSHEWMGTTHDVAQQRQCVRCFAHERMSLEKPNEVCR